MNGCPGRKHSEATEVKLQLRKMSTHILLVVEDNGRGLTEEKTQGIGISNFRAGCSWWRVICNMIQWRMRGRRQ